MKNHFYQELDDSKANFQNLMSHARESYQNRTRTLLEGYDVV